MRFVLVVILSIKLILCRRADSEKIITFKSSVAKNGSFKSPNYPYWSDTENYKEYHFVGNEARNERVQIIFEHFNLNRKSNYNCEQANALLSYHRSDKTLVELCGNEIPLPILSDNNTFHMTYKQSRKLEKQYIPEYGEDHGFNATYKFVSNFGIESGNQFDDDCSFVYDSDIEKNGTINSPNYPGYYPRPMKCTYYFQGTEPYLRFNFINFNLLGSNRCIDGDYVELTETVDKDEKYFYKKICGSVDSFTEVVNATYFWVIFQSTGLYLSEAETAQHPFVGFLATYEFTNVTSSRGSNFYQSGPVPIILLFLFRIIKEISLIMS